MQVFEEIITVNGLNPVETAAGLRKIKDMCPLKRLLDGYGQKNFKQYKSDWKWKTAQVSES